MPVLLVLALCLASRPADPKGLPPSSEAERQSILKSIDYEEKNVRERLERDPEGFGMDCAILRGNALRLADEKDAASKAAVQRVNTLCLDEGLKRAGELLLDAVEKSGDRKGCTTA